MADRVGQQVGTYQLERLLGTGGFAEVYLGRQIHLGTQAAIKLLRTQLVTAEDVARFRAEAATVAHLRHPHIVRVLEFDVQQGVPFLVMDYARNGSLRQRHPKGTRLAPGVIVFYLNQIAEGLDYAHDQRLIHRDIKPGNLLLGEQGEVVLADFGVALMLQQSQTRSLYASVAGTPAYMAPEQAQGRPQRASDLYSLGAILCEWLTGAPPPRGWYAGATGQAPPSLRERVPGLPVAVEQVVQQALALNPRERFQSARELARAFEQACQPGSISFSTHPQPAPGAGSPPGAGADPYSTKLTPTVAPPPGSAAPGAPAPPGILPPGSTPPAPFPPPGSPSQAARPAGATPIWPGGAPGTPAARPSSGLTARLIALVLVVAIIVAGGVGVAYVLSQRQASQSNTPGGQQTPPAGQTPGPRTSPTQPGQPSPTQTPGTNPTSAPPDGASFTLNVQIQAQTIFGMQDNQQDTLIVSPGKVCQAADNGQKRTYNNGTNNNGSDVTIATTCTGSYTGGHLSYTETATYYEQTTPGVPGSDCRASNLPFKNQVIDGSFSSSTESSGSFQTDQIDLLCADDTYDCTYYSETGTWTGTLAQGGLLAQWGGRPMPSASATPCTATFPILLAHAPVPLASSQLGLRVPRLRGSPAARRWHTAALQVAIGLTKEPGFFRIGVPGRRIFRCRSMAVLQRGCNDG